jgi:predicted DNA-binding transcriptional regulator YafY
VGYSDRSNNSLVFALDRIQSLETSKKKEEYYTDPDFDAKKYFNYSFGVTHFHDAKPEKVILSFQPGQANYILSQPLHHSQQLILQNERETRIELYVFITQELIMAILGYGDGVKVIEPAGLIQKIKESINSMGKLYR